MVKSVAGLPHRLVPRRVSGGGVHPKIMVQLLQPIYLQIAIRKELAGSLVEISYLAGGYLPQMVLLHLAHQIVAGPAVGVGTGAHHKAIPHQLLELGMAQGNAQDPVEAF